MNVKLTAQAVNRTFNDEKAAALALSAAEKTDNPIEFLDAVIAELVNGLKLEPSNWRVAGVRAAQIRAGGARVGMGATKHGYSDADPYHVIAVNKSGRTLTLQAAKAEIDPSWKADFVPGGFCGTVVNQGSQRWTITPDANGEVVKVRLHKDGTWRDAHGSRYTIGRAGKFYDYNF